MRTASIRPAIPPLAALLLAVLPATHATENSAAPAKPNIILILADDLGYETIVAIGASGGTSSKTPVLKQFAASGARFTHYYAQPLCTPTRVQLMASPPPSLPDDAPLSERPRCDGHESKFLADRNPVLAKKTARGTPLAVLAVILQMRTYDGSNHSWRRPFPAWQRSFHHLELE